VSGDLLPAERRRLELARRTFATAIGHIHAAHHEASALTDDRGAAGRAVGELQAAIAELQAALAVMRELAGA
jgi:hypothetical protein